MCSNFCPSCHAKRLASWTLWLGDELLAPVPHRQMVFVLPKRLRPYFRWHRKLLGHLARIAARTATEFVRATLDEPDVSVGIVLCIQTHGSHLNWQPHIHAMVTDGGFRPDGTFVPLLAHSAEVLTEAFRRGVLMLFVDRELFEPEVAGGMLGWQHSGFSVHDGVWLDQDAQRRWADLLRRIYEVDPLQRPKCGGTMRVIALILEPKVVDKILRHLRAKGRDARAGPWATGRWRAGRRGVRMAARRRWRRGWGG